MAPEILVAQDCQGECGYSFGVDIWAVGVIMYTMVVGRPPFEMPALEETYKRIKDVAFSFPSAEQRERRGLEALSPAFEDLVSLIL